MANEAEFTTFNITDDQAITPEVRQQAAQRFQEALQYNWDQDGKSEFIDSMGRPMDKPASVDDWRFQNMGEFGTIPRYADLNKTIDEQKAFFENATDEEIRKALKPPNDMGKFAEKSYAEILKEKNYQDNLFTQGQPPDTDVRKANEVLKEKEEELSDEQKDARKNSKKE